MADGRSEGEGEGEGDDPLFFLDLRSITQVPCFRRSMLYGTGLGMAITGHTFFRTGRIFAATNAGVLTFAAAAAGAWYLCRSRERAQRQALRQMMASQGAGGDGAAGAPLTPEVAAKLQGPAADTQSRSGFSLDAPPQSQPPSPPAAGDGKAT